jgi:hypothetical protein
MASPLVLRFAQNVEKLNTIPSGGIQLAFGLPNGAAAPPALLAQITSGIQPNSSDTEKALSLLIQRNVLLAVCRAAGAPNNPARTEEILGHASALIQRSVFESAVADILSVESALYARDKLDDPDKLEAVRRRAQLVASGATRPASTTDKVAPVEAGVH